jgi:hypothetical protein
MVRIVVWSLAVLTLLFFLTGCRSHVAYVYSGVDPLISTLSKTDPIFFEMPDDPSIRERKLAVLLKDELIKNGFNIVSDFGESKWTLSFAVDRNTYTIGSATHGAVVGGVLSARTNYVQQTDVTIFMHLFRTTDLEKLKPVVFWEGSITTKDQAFLRMPNSTIKNLLDRFGQNFEKPTTLDRDYQRDVNVQKTAKQVENK